VLILTSVYGICNCRVGKQCCSSRLVIHTPQQVKVIHKYHTTEQYAKGYGYGYNHHRKPKKSRRPTKGRRPWRGRSRYRKRYQRKVGHRVFKGGKSYGMYNYAKNYRNWTPQHKPQKRYRDSYVSFGDSQVHDGDQADSDYYEYEDSVTESTPFGNEIHAIDYYAKRYGNFDRYDRRKGNIPHRDRQHDHFSLNSYQPNNAAVESRLKEYSTLPDEIINSPISSAGHDFQYTSAADQDFREFKNQNPSEAQDFRVFKNQNPSDAQDFRVFKNQNPSDAQDFRVFKNQNPSDPQDFRVFKNQNPSDGQDFRVFKNHNAGHGQQFRFDNQNFGGGQDSRLKNQNQSSGKRQEFRFKVQNFPAVQGTQFSSHSFGNGQSPAGRDDLRYSTQTVGGTHELQYNTRISQTGQESRLRNQNSGGEHDLLYNTQNSAGRYNNHKSASGAHSNDSGFPVSHGNTNDNHSHRETVHTFGEVVDSRPTAEDLYYKAFRSFSFRKNPSHSSSKDQLDAFSGASFNNKHVPQTSSPSFQSGIAHSDRENNQWFNGRTGPNKDHDIGFFEGLEDINDGAGI